MRKLILLFATAFVVTPKTYGLAISKQGDSSFVNLNKSSITSGVLLESKMDTLLRLHEMDGTKVATRTYEEWRNINYFMSRASFTKKELPTHTKLQKLNDSIKYVQLKNQKWVVPVFVQNYKYHIIKGDAENKNLLIKKEGKYYDVPGRTESPYEERRIVTSGIFQRHFSESREITLYFSSETYFTNDNQTFSRIEIDAEDGLGYRNFPLNQPLTVKYSSDGLKKVVVKVYTTSSTSYSSGFDLVVGSANCVAPYDPDFAPWSYSDASGNTYWTISTTLSNGNTQFGNAYLKYGFDQNNVAHTALTKPFIFVEGIDFNNTNTNTRLQNGDLGWCAIFGGGNNQLDFEHNDYFFLEKYPILVENLRNQGYDVILLDFYDGADYVQNNSMLLVKLIELVNSNKAGNEPIVVSGASMGGQISRYALAYMEKNDMPSCARMYISMDSPHQGSYIPPGLQHMFQFLSSYALDKISSSAEEKLDKTLNRPAAKQLTNYQAIENAVRDYRDPYYAELTSLGYPQNVRRVGVANGSKNSVGLPFSDGDKLFEFSWTPWTCFNASVIDLNVYATPGGGVKGTVFDGKVPTSLASVASCLLLTTVPCALCLSTGIGYAVKSVDAPSSSAGWDRAPGGKRRTMLQIERDLKETIASDAFFDFIADPTIEANQENHSFIPTMSALDINTSNLFLDISSIVYPNPVNPSLTPFHAIYAPTSNNEQHSEATNDNINFVLTEVLNGQNYLESPLSSSSLNNGVFNFAHPAQKVIPSVQVESGGKLYVNANLPANYGQTIWNQPVYYPVSGSTLELFTSDCGNTLVEIKSGGEFILGESSLNNKTIVRIRSGSTLRLYSGSKLVVNSGSKIIIENGALFIVNSGAEIQNNGEILVEQGNGTVSFGTNTKYTGGTGSIFKLGTNTTFNCQAGAEIQNNGQILAQGNGTATFGANTQYKGSSTLFQPSLLQLGSNISFNWQNGASIELVNNKTGIEIQNPNTAITINNGESFTTTKGTTATQGGYLSFPKTSTFNLKTGGQIECDGTRLTLGKLNYEANGDIQLTTSSSVLEILDKIQCQGDASFSFKHPDNGSGFIRFTNAAIIGGTNSAIVEFAGTGNTDKVIELNSGLSIVDNDENRLNLSDCLISGGNLSANTWANIDNIAFNNGTLTFGSNNTADNGVLIRNSSFDYSDIYSDLLGIIPVHVENTTFQNGQYGIYSIGAGVVLKNTTIRNCFYGPLINYAAISSSIENSVFQNNGTGIYYDLSDGMSISIKNSSVTDNIENLSYGTPGIGLYASGSSNAEIRCGNINNNTTGIRAESGIYLDMSSVLNGGWVDATENKELTIDVQLASMLYLNKGYNTLYSHCIKPTQCTKQAINGSLQVGNCSLGTYTLDANNNVWNNLNPQTPPAWNKDYELYFCGSRHVNIADTDPKTFECGKTGIGNDDCPPYCDVDFLSFCPGCVAITTKDFVRVKLNEAILFAISKMQRDEWDDIRHSVDLFHQILRFPIVRPRPEEEQLLLLAYRKMLEAIGRAFLHGAISRTENSPIFTSEVEMLLDVQNQIINRAIHQNDYSKRFYTNLEKANTYRQSGRRDLSMNTLNDMSAWVQANERPYLEQWRCLVNTELMVVNKQITSEKFFETLFANCPALARSPMQAKGENNMEGSENPVINAGKTEKIKVYPNPAEEELIVQIPNEASYTITFRNILGQEVCHYTTTQTLHLDVSKWQKGLYFIEVKDGQSSERIVQKVVVN